MTAVLLIAGAIGPPVEALATTGPQSLLLSFETGILWPQGGFEQASESGTLFSLGVQASLGDRWAAHLRVGYGQFVGSANDKLRLGLAPIDLTAKFQMPFESGFAPYLQAGFGGTMIRAQLESGAEIGWDAGPVAGVGVDLHADSGLGLGIGALARAFPETGARSLFWTLEAGIRVSWRVTGRAP